MSCISTPKPEQETSKRLIAIELKDHSNRTMSANIEHERKMAIFDLLEQNVFSLTRGDEAGPFRLILHLRERRSLILKIQRADHAEICDIVLPLARFRKAIKDYYLVCESYYNAIRRLTPSQIETIDMARRALHDEGAQSLAHALASQIALDHKTARRLFTLLCVLVSR